MISWNIRHLRPDKVDDYGAYIAFLYENKVDNNRNGACILALIDLMKKKTKVDWGGVVTPVQTNENVLTIYRKQRGSTTIAATADDSYMRALSQAGEKGVLSSMNDTIMSNRSVGRPPPGEGGAELVARCLGSSFE